MDALHIVRSESTDEGTFGAATFQHLHLVSLELPWRDNQPNVSCIPLGQYLGKRVYSEHFGRWVYALRDVPGRECVECHPANFAGDTSQGWHSDLRGCLCLGLEHGTIDNPDGKPQRAVLSSAAALNQVMNLAGECDIMIVIMEISNESLAA